MDVGDEEAHRVVDDELGGDRVEEREPERERPALAQDLLAVPEVDQLEVGRPPVRWLGRGVDAEQDLFDLELGVRSRGGRDAVARKRGVRVVVY